MNKESKIIPINSTTDAFRNQMALFLQRMLDINEWILSFPPIRGDKGIDDMWMIDASLPEYMHNCHPEWFSCYEFNCEVMLNTMHKDLFNEKSLSWFREHLEAFAPYSEGARKLLKVIEKW